MIDDLKPYSAYGMSGIPWFGSMPTHWQVRPLKHWVTINKVSLPEDTSSEYEFEYLDIGAVGTGVLKSKPIRMRFGDAPSRARRVLRDGDTIVSTVRTYLKSVYYIGENARDLIASTGFAVLSPGGGVLPKYLSYLVQSNAFTDHVTSDSVGTAYPAIAETRLASFAVVMPPLDEQTAIVRYLDFVGRHIRSYIHSKHKIIALLTEQKQAIIQEAVMRGLDPNVWLKPSGVEWLGDVPQHWDVTRSKYVFREIDCRSATGAETHLSMSQKFGLIPSSQIEEKRLISDSYAGAKLCEKGDLVLNRLKAHLGVFALAREGGLVSPDYTVLRPVRKIEPRYFEAVYRTPACRVELRQRAKGIVQGFWRLYTDDFYDIRVPFPPLAEQQCIVERLNTELSSLDGAIGHVEREIQLLSEYRIRLITDIVTGKVDVRDAAANLPDEPKDEEPIEEADTDLEGKETIETVASMLNASLEDAQV
jgi:type I restriction enzyme, S subunit